MRRHIADIHLAQDLIGFRPAIDLKEGLKRAIEWHRKESSPYVKGG